MTPVRTERCLSKARDLGTSPWQLVIERYTNFPRVRKPNRNGWLWPDADDFVPCTKVVSYPWYCGRVRRATSTAVVVPKLTSSDPGRSNRFS